MGTPGCILPRAVPAPDPPCTACRQIQGLQCLPVAERGVAGHTSRTSWPSCPPGWSGNRARLQLGLAPRFAAMTFKAGSRLLAVTMWLVPAAVPRARKGRFRVLFFGSPSRGNAAQVRKTSEGGGWSPSKGCKGWKANSPCTCSIPNQGSKHVFPPAPTHLRAGSALGWARPFSGTGPAPLPFRTPRQRCLAPAPSHP